MDQTQEAASNGKPGPIELPDHDAEGPIPPYPPRRRDENGRPLPFTPEEARLGMEIMRREMALIDALYQDPPGSDEEFMRNMDENRPEGYKLFDKYYP